MQNVRWLSFCISNAVTRSVVHFFPSSANVAAPYAAECSLTLFGRDSTRKTVVLEGARFGQPDGVRLDDAFPALQEGTSGFFGLEFSISSNQPRTDLQTSGCILELSSRGHSCRFRPLQLIVPEDVQGRALTPEPHLHGPALGIKDSFNTTSLVLVNGSDAVYNPKVAVRSNSPGEFGKGLSLEPLAAQNVIEIDLGEQFVASDEAPRECSWGLLRSGGIWLTEPPPLGVAAYLMYRDVVTRRPVSVSCL